MKTFEFLELLKANQNKDLRFEYKPQHFVAANYHITEVKNITVDAVDCGARTDYWKETVVQLWESPIEKGKTEFMSVYKALGILNKVNRIKPMIQDAELKIEYSNDAFHTAQLFVDDYTINEQSLVFRLAVEKTDCKAKDACGVPAVVEAVKEACCGTESGCC